MKVCDKSDGCSRLGGMEKEKKVKDTEKQQERGGGGGGECQGEKKKALMPSLLPHLKTSDDR